MGVPITFLDKYNPNQFEILGMCASAGYDKDIVGIPFEGKKDARPIINGGVSMRVSLLKIKIYENRSKNNYKEIQRIILTTMRKVLLAIMES